MTAEVFSYESLVHAVSGAVGSVTAMTVFFPLDTARLRLQVDENRKAKSTPAILADIVKEEGLLAPYRGWFPVICSLCCSNFVYFYCFHWMKASWLKSRQSTPSTDLIVGIVAGVINVLLTTPLWVVNTRLKLQGSKFHNSDIRPTNYSGILDAFKQIVRKEGVGALWNGTFPSLLLVLNPAIQFMVYEGLKRQLRRGASREVSLEAFVSGGLHHRGGRQSCRHHCYVPTADNAVRPQVRSGQHTDRKVDAAVQPADPPGSTGEQSQETRCVGSVQRPGGQASADRPDCCPHVPSL
ncbi:peroxisomal membrane protein PMP34 isoform X2 [Poecilia formosa]|uniref:peroxisomal membrane protein PMP34 isoform X2 n=1 Tax=Poecilia formosa TaxID=48698 RepID=UPI0007B885DA|nr:PREDICTED: peroxisomal membrane protein PMP34 isoform X2 [Poecilia formosa]